MDYSFKIEIILSGSLTARQRSEIISLCNLAYGEDISSYLDNIGAGTHFLGYIDDKLVSHVMQVERWLQIGTAPFLKTAYVELVATVPEHRRCGYASMLLRRLIEELPEAYKLVALSPATSGIYSRLGWRFWQGPLSIRMPSGESKPSPEEQVMIFVLPWNPITEFSEPLSIEWRAGEVW